MLVFEGGSKMGKQEIFTMFLAIIVLLQNFYD